MLRGFDKFALLQSRTTTLGHSAFENRNRLNNTINQSIKIRAKPVSRIRDGSVPHPPFWFLISYIKHMKSLLFFSACLTLHEIWLLLVNKQPFSFTNPRWSESRRDMVLHSHTAGLVLTGGWWFQHLPPVPTTIHHYATSLPISTRSTTTFATLLQKKFNSLLHK